VKRWRKRERVNAPTVENEEKDEEEGSTDLEGEREYGSKENVKKE